MAVPEPENSSSLALSTVLKTLSDSVSSAILSLPTHKPHDETGDDDTSILAPTDGISLLDTKNEIFLSYLQSLAFLLLLQVRQIAGQSASQSNGNVNCTQEEVVKKLVELRIYLERGVKPLEGRLKYQIDKVLKAAEDAERAQRKATEKKPRRKRKIGGSDSEAAFSAESDAGSSNSAQTSDDEQDIDDLAYRPNLAAFSKAAQQETGQATSTKSKPTDGIYRPPKIKPTALPADFSDRRSDREARRPDKSRVIDEFVSAEMSAAPAAEPSIGSTIRAGGREVRTQREREVEVERRTYEESNFVRLPKESKKDRAKRGGKRQAGFGGEDWRSLGEGADRIERLTRRSNGSGGALDRSRKRRLTEDGPRGDGIKVGEGFEKRRKMIARRKR
ncbi:hypothetical protein PRK78_007531 [Emydomyces testavorans]|uniref:Uncharacterized protein n=1 Tax=Emydomyces testavorans TaxID=2070801 RepID=A0AAF0DRK0_9EURO|nr:hypothetical protein PRK78_007531 [Emydomyces testavorans]